jgi:NSS family neurotransmitter:Na+ symporter
MVVSLLGVAIGLGNFWRFPYMMGIFGGGAFLAIYLAVVCLIGIPTLLAEITLGRATGRGPVGAFTRAGLPAGPQIGMMLFFGVGMAMTYYLVVLGWILAFFLRSAGWLFGVGELTGDSFSLVHGSVWVQLECSAIVAIAAATVVSRGVQGGIERISRVFLPLFGSLTIGLAIWALSLPGAMEGVRYIFTVDLARLTPRAIMAAVGQAFFSLGLGGTFLVIYGSYMPADTPLPRRALTTALGDVFASMLGVLLIMPIAFVYGLSPASGPPLLFEVLPAAFRAMPNGAFFATLFFLGLGCIAFLSGVAAVEVLVGSLSDHFGWRRSRVVWGVAGMLVIMGLPAMLSVEYIVWSDLLWGSTMQPVGSVAAVIALTWGLGKHRAIRELAGTGEAPRWAILWFQWIRWVVPVVVLVALLSGWLG